MPVCVCVCINSSLKTQHEKSKREKSGKKAENKQGESRGDDWGLARGGREGEGKVYIAGKVKCIINVQTGLSSENYAKQKKKKNAKHLLHD